MLGGLWIELRRIRFSSHDVFVAIEFHLNLSCIECDKLGVLN